MYLRDDDTITCDIERIRREVATARPGRDVVFDLWIIAVSTSGASLKAYLMPWEELQKAGPRLSKTRSQLSQYAVAPPPELDVRMIASEMGLLGIPNEG